jgi:hypothetical protein
VAGHPVNRARPITPEQLIQISSSIDTSSQKEVTYFTAMIVAFFSLLRKSNYTASAQSPGRVLFRNQLFAFGNLMELRVDWTKTLQDKSHVIRIPLVPIPGSPICPVLWLSKMLLLNRPEPNAPLFSFKGGKPLAYSSFNNFLKKRLCAIGVDARGYSTHSLRRGGATYAAKCGVSDAEIKLLGDWKSNCYQVYLACPFEQRLASALKVKRELLALSND